MNTLKRWLPIALCCLPGVATLVVIGLGVAVGGSVLGAFFNGPLGLGLIALAVLACPLSMGLMMWRGTKPNADSGDSATLADCCLPGEAATISATDSERLADLRARREALERELAEVR
jgi:hypothetical protein